MHGQGELVIDNVNYTGSFENGQYSGKGILTVKEANGNKIYTGNFKNGMKHGLGKIIWEDGNKSYDGGWKND